jgi:hypothetical protein
MRFRGLTAVVFALLGVVAARAQDGSWGDSSAAIFNTPMGYKSHAEINAAIDSRNRAAARKTRKEGDQSALGCFSTVHGVSAGTDAHLAADQKPHRAENPCIGFGVAAPGGTLTVETTGAWNTVIVETHGAGRQRHDGELNGGLTLD